MNNDYNTNLQTNTENQMNNLNDPISSPIIDRLIYSTYILTPIIETHYSNFITAEKCSEEGKELLYIKNLKAYPLGNCMFDSLILELNIEKAMCSELRKYLLNSDSIIHCTNITQTTWILKSTSEYGDLDCLYVREKKFNTNICVHYQIKNEKLQF